MNHNPPEDASSSTSNSNPNAKRSLAPGGSNNDGEDNDSNNNDSEGGPSQTKRQRRSGLKHASRACDACKSRKSRCDGAQPVCGFCASKKLSCTYDKEDKRRGRGSVVDLRDRINTLVDLLTTKGTSLGPGEGGAGSSDNPISPPNNINLTSSQMQQISSLGVNSDSILSDSNMLDNNMMTFPSDPMISPVTSLTFPIHNQDHDLNLLESPANPIPMGLPSSSMRRPSDASLILNNPRNQPAERRPSGSPYDHSPVSQVSNRGDRLKRPDPGSLMQFGPTSLWSYAQDKNPASNANATSSEPFLDLRPGDWIDWARPLPPELDISKAVHDMAISFFGAYYAPWCMVIDMQAFLRDLEICNLVTRTPRTSPSPRRTSAYSPLLHVCALYLGLHLRRDDWTTTAQQMDRFFDKHCAALIMEEIEDPSTSTLRALNIFATCLNIRKDKSARNTGYIYFGMAFAAVQALGVDLNCDHLVLSGQITTEEREMRNNTYWTVFQQDLLRAIAAGRPPMLRGRSEIPLPTINPDTDSRIWFSNNPLKVGSSNGLQGMFSTVFHWSTRIHQILRRTLETPLYSGQDDTQDRDAKVLGISRELHDWFQQQPFQQPTLHPVPHLLVMHMMYQLTTIYLFRPYYRSELDITPSPADRCVEAAARTSELLRVYENEHGLRNGVATLIPIVFAIATVQLLVLVSNHSDPPGSRVNNQSLDETVWFINQLAPSWIEARRGLEVIQTLRSEWLPGSNADIIVGNNIGNTGSSGSGLQVQSNHTNNIILPNFDQSDKLPEELHEWLMSTTFYDILHNNGDNNTNINNFSSDMTGGP
ncbi:uncharacterized protein L201_000530 [Kwoniella dendrophila CBS 6074]|uniref:Zn(2)-C6 fungal-type domain-containing protein n=1 Tax=Kwoniella dendrophila CBS 6074 TaxID=1295534 RepID=A0AAX4JJS7_9TREE